MRAAWSKRPARKIPAKGNRIALGAPAYSINPIAIRTIGAISVRFAWALILARSDTSSASPNWTPPSLALRSVTSPLKTTSKISIAAVNVDVIGSSTMLFIKSSRRVLVSPAAVGMGLFKACFAEGS